MPATNPWPPGRRRLLLIAAPPILAAVVVSVVVLLGGNQPSPTTVEIREAGAPRGAGSPAEAIAVAESRSGLKVILPSTLPNNDYRLVYVDVLGTSESGSPGVNFGFRDRNSPDGPWFWVTQKPANAIKLPLPLPEFPTNIDGAHLWLAAGRPANIGGNPQSLQFVARTSRFDRIISFEGSTGPDEDTARKVILSMLRQDEEGR